MHRPCNREDEGQRRNPFAGENKVSSRGASGLSGSRRLKRPKWDGSCLPTGTSCYYWTSTCGARQSPFLVHLRESSETFLPLTRLSDRRQSHIPPYVFHAASRQVAQELLHLCRQQDHDGCLHPSTLSPAKREAQCRVASMILPKKG